MHELKPRFLKHYIPLSILTLIIGIAFFFIWTKKDLITLITDVTGYIAIVLLSVSLIIGTINFIRKGFSPVSTYFRRDISVFGGILAIIHSICGLFVHLRGNMWQYFFKKPADNYIIRLDDFGIANYTGLLSAIVIVLLLAISNDFSIKRIKAKRWKNIQRFAYLMFLLAIVHILFYRVISENLNIYYYFYLPLILIVLTFQSVGFILRIRKS